MSSTTTPDGATTFRRILVNTLLASVTSTYLSFAVTFWVYLETRSILAASLMSGISMLVGALSGTFFGAFVDAHRKMTSMLVSTVVTLVAFAGAAAVFLSVPTREIADWTGVWFWAFAGLVLVGAVVGQLRSIALSTTVTLLIPEDRRDRANGMVGTVTGLAHMITSVFSGLSIGLLGMGGTVVIAVVLTGFALGHLVLIRIDEPPVQRSVDDSGSGFSPRTAWLTLRSVPGLLPLVFFTTFNNLVMGVYMTLMDPYGLTLFSVEAWGVVLGAVSVGFIAGGALVARFGLGRSPVRTLLLVNVLIALIGMGSAFRDSQALLVAGMFGFMLVIPIAEAAEQTVLQRLVPFEKQGRVFGFAHSVESASTPVAAFVVGPLAQFLLVPFMATEQGRSTFGWLLGGGEARGIALTFVAASSVMLVVVLLAFSSKAYRRLSRSYDSASPAVAPAAVQLQPV
jgi:MFS transporter, DHA3 family, multidrug efflux protein